MKQNMNIQDMLREMTEMQAEDWDPPSNPDQESLTPVPEAPVRHFLMKQKREHPGHAAWDDWDARGRLESPL